MGKARPVLIHLALGLAGWGIAFALSPLLSSSENHAAPVSTALPSKTDRPRLDVPGGRRILARLMPARDPDRAPSLPDGKAVLFDQNAVDLRVDAYIEGIDSVPGDLDPAMVRETVLDAILQEQLESLINGEHGPDLAYAFRHGRMDALEIRDLLAAQFPDHATHPVFLRTLYCHLAPHDPLRAEVLLDALPDPEAANMKYHIALAAPDTLAPSHYYQLFASIPPSDNPNEIQRRRIVLATAVGDFLGLYDSDFTHFVEILPPGEDRDLSLQVIADDYEDSNPAEAARLRALTQVLHGLDGE